MENSTVLYAAGIPSGDEFTKNFREKNKNLILSSISVFSYHEKVNGIKLLCNSLEEIDRKLGVKSYLIVVGGGILLDEFKSYLKSSGLETKVILLGNVIEPLKIVAKTDIFCHISFKDNIPLSLLEASDINMPILVSDIGGVKEIFDNQKSLKIISNEEQEVISSICELYKKVNFEEDNFIIKKKVLSWPKCAYNQLLVYKNLI